MDTLDLLKPRGGYTQQGTYRRYQTDEPQYFDYKEVKSPSARFGTIINNLITDDSTQVIESPQNCSYEVGGFVVLQDGSSWSVTTVEKVNNNEENMRIWALNPSTRFIVGLQNMENSKRLK